MKRWILIVALTAACRPHPVAPRADGPLPPPPPIAVLPGDPGTHTVKPGPARAESPAPAVEPEPPKLRRPVDAVISEINARLKDAFFPYDRADLSDEALAELRRDADLLSPILADYPDVTVVVEGHCDERGSAEYNLALGDRRATRAAELLQQFGVAPSRTSIVSYGKERPQCSELNETCWRQNRRAHLLLRNSP